MWIHITTARVELSNKDKLAELLSTEKLLAMFRAQKGFRAYYLVENIGNPNEMASITLWETQKDGETFFASPMYKEILVGGIPLIVGRPENEAFNVRAGVEVPISELA